MGGSLLRLLGCCLVLCVAIIAEDERCTYWSQLGRCLSNATVNRACPLACQTNWQTEPAFVVDAGTSLLALEDVIATNEVQQPCFLGLQRVSHNLRI